LANLKNIHLGLSFPIPKILLSQPGGYTKFSIILNPLEYETGLSGLNNPGTAQSKDLKSVGAFNWFSETVRPVRLSGEFWEPWGF